jgi:hypothetical protein
VVQHLSQEIIELVLENCYKKLKPGGKALIHAQMDDSIFGVEEEWRADTSLKGKIKYRYGLHCFARTPEFFQEMLPQRDLEIFRYWR